MDNKALKIGIVSGIVSSLVVILFIHPILSFIWNAVLTIGGAVHQGYIGRIYINAAVADRNLLGQLTFLVLLFMFPLFGILFLLMRTVVSPPGFINLSRFASSLLLLGQAVLFCFLLVTFSLSSGIMEISASFTQRLTVLAPAVSDAEYKTLKARWASMRGKADYEAIVTEMDRRATELGITLPRVRKP